jgi:hypothetical protein
MDFLESNQDFSTCIKARIDKMISLKIQDYKFSNFMENSKGGVHLSNIPLYLLAKELSCGMKRKGKEARDISCM